MRAPSVAEDDEAVEDAKGDRRDRKEVDAGQLSSYGCAERWLGLRGRLVSAAVCTWQPWMGDGDAELEQLAWIRGAPQPGFSVACDG